MVLGLIIPIIGFFSLGLFIISLFRFNKTEKRMVSDLIVESLIVGIAVLIIPLLIIGVYLSGNISKYMYFYYFLCLLCIIYYVLKLPNLIKLDGITKLRNKIIELSEKPFIFIILFILFDYLILAFIYPIRGWDALHIYFPNAYYFYISNHINFKINPLNFYVNFKPPLNSLLYSYSFYISNGFEGNLIPFIFILGICFLTYSISKELNLSNRIAYIAIIIFLITPTSYITIIEYYYYQELFIAFFFSAGLIYFYKAYKYNSFYYYLISSLSFILATYSKISGFSLFILILMIFPLFNKKFSKFQIYFVNLIIISFLVLKASYDISIWIGISILIFGLLNLIMIIKDINLLDHKKVNKKFILFFLVLSISIVFTWIYHWSTIPGLINEITSRYLHINHSSIILTYNNNKLVQEIYLENAHSINIFTTIFVILIGQQFALFLTPLKVIGIFKSRKNFQFLNSWLFSFYILWLAFYANISVRYLTVIWIPLAILTAIGLETFSKYFNSHNMFVYLIIASIYLFYYPFIPFQYIFLQFNYRLYYYNKSIILLLTYLFSFYVILYLFYKSLSKLNFRNKLYKKYFSISLILIIILSPIATQITYLSINNFNVQKFDNTFVSTNNDAINNLSNFMNNLVIGINDITVVVNIPGLEYFIKRPVLDLYLTTGEFQNIPNSFLTSSNLTLVHQNFLTDKIRFIISLTINHPYYLPFVKYYLTKYPFFNYLSYSNFTNLIYQNKEFNLYEIVT